MSTIKPIKIRHKPTSLSPPNPSNLLFLHPAISIGSFTRPSPTPRIVSVNCSSDNRETESIRDLLSGMVDERVEELLNREENRVMLDELEKASQRVEMARKELESIKTQEIEAAQMKDYVQKLESRTSEIAECQKELLEARAMVEEAERSLSSNMEGVSSEDALKENETDDIDRDAERLESLKAALISAMVGTLAGIPISFSQPSSSAQLILHLSVIFFSCALFGVTFRYTIRRDLDNIQRRAGLIQMHKVSGGAVNWLLIPGLRSNGSQMESGKMKKVVDRPASCNSNCDEDHRPATTAKSKTVAGIFKDGLKQILGRSNSMNGTSIFSKNGTSSSRESKHVPLPEFLRASDSIGLSVCAMNVKLNCYRAWPNMHDNRYALYKLPLRAPAAGQEYAGLWGGSFGWPPGRPAEDKPGTALFFLLISYEECDGQRTLIATKILEGTHYVLHPNGSAMFIVKVDEPSSELFPWDNDGNSVRIEIKNAYNGEGIANGYGFRYPGSKPGSLFVTQNGLLAFVWKESRAVLTLQRLNLQELLKKGERVPALPPIANFSYLTKSYSNVFTSFSIASSSLPSPK